MAADCSDLSGINFSHGEVAVEVSVMVTSICRFRSSRISVSVMQAQRQ